MQIYTLVCDQMSFEKLLKCHKEYVPMQFNIMLINHIFLFVTCIQQAAFKLVMVDVLMKLFNWMLLNGHDHPFIEF